MGPGEAIRTGVARTFEFEGRAVMSEFWWFSLACAAVILIAYQVDARIYAPERFEKTVPEGPVMFMGLPVEGGQTVRTVQVAEGSPMVGYLAALVWAVVALPLASAARRRLRDAALSPKPLYYLAGSVACAVVTWIALTGPLVPLFGYAVFGVSFLVLAPLLIAGLLSSGLLAWRLSRLSSAVAI